jgi:hypothetical protein
MLLADLSDFVTRHHPHGTLTAEATEPAANGYMLMVVCSVRCHVPALGHAGRGGAGVEFLASES